MAGSVANGMAGTMRGLIARVLRQRAAAGRAGVAAADAVYDRRVAEERRMTEAMAQEAAFQPAFRDGAAAAEGAVLAAAGTAWRQVAAGRMEVAREATRRASEASGTARAALAETVRTEKGFDLLMARHDAAAAQHAARRDTLAQLMVLARLPAAGR